MSTGATGLKMCNGVPWEVAVLQKILHRYPEIVDELGKSVVNRRLSKPYLALAMARFRAGDYKSARILFRKAAAYWPTNLRYWGGYSATFLHPVQIAAARKLYHQVSKSVPERAISKPMSSVGADT